MMDAWDVITEGVYSLPHKVEWFDDNKIGDPRYLKTKIHNMFIVPSSLVVALGASAWDKAQELADTSRCDLIKANDGSWIFKRRT